MQKDVQQGDYGLSLKDVVDNLRKLLSYLSKKWAIILSGVILGSSFGLVYAWLQPVKYVSRTSFVLEDNKSMGGGLAAIAGQFGFDIAGTAGGGIFSGDNILLFLKSESLCRETLLTNYGSSNNVLADKYAEANKLKEKWAKNKKVGQINFAKYKNGNFPRLEDSLIQGIIKTILKEDLRADKPDKKASFIEVKVSMPDELLSKYFGERLVKIATDHYVDSKIKLKALNVAKLQRRADSLGGLLNNRTYTAAATQQGLIDANPGLKIAPVSAEIAARDKTMVATIFAEVVKNLEIAKVALSQETPTIQMVDQSTLPLKKDKVSKAISIVVGGIVLGIFFIIFLLLRRWWRNQLFQLKKESATESNASIEVVPKVFIQKKQTGIDS